jgi:hypothetical protein
VRFVTLTTSVFASQRRSGVRYFYIHAAKLAVTDLPTTMLPEDLETTLLATLRDEPERAVLSLDPARVALFVSQILGANATLGSVLGSFVRCPLRRLYDDPDR